MKIEEEGPSEKVSLLSRSSQPATRIDLETGVSYFKVRLGHEAEGPRVVGILHLVLGLQKLDKSNRIRESRDSLTPAADDIRADVWMSIQKGNWRILSWAHSSFLVRSKGGNLQKWAWESSLPSCSGSSLLEFGILHQKCKVSLEKSRLSQAFRQRKINYMKRNRK